MHPDMMRALARARHDDLLNTYPTRGQPRVRLNWHVTPFSRSRHLLGALLIRAGARLADDGGAGLEIAHE